MKRWFAANFAGKARQRFFRQLETIALVAGKRKPFLMSKAGRRLSIYLHAAENSTVADSLWYDGS